jgi:hypothetical protein
MGYMKDGQSSIKALVRLCMGANAYCPHVVVAGTSLIMRMWMRLLREVLLLSFLGRVTGSERHQPPLLEMEGGILEGAGLVTRRMLE